MFKSMLMQANRWAITQWGRERVSYVVSNTMTNFNRRLNPFLWTYDLKAVVVAIHDETNEVKTLTLLPNQHWKSMKAGQYVELHCDINGETIKRYYSLSPLQADCFTVTVKRVGGGRVSGWIHDHVRRGMTFTLTPPRGDFHYRQQSAVLFLCAGSGITPCYSMVTDLLEHHTRTDIQVYAQFSCAAQVIFADTLAAWKTRGVRVDIALSRDEAGLIASGDYQVPLDEENFETRFPDFRERDLYLCGPLGFMEKVVGILEAKGYDPQRLHVERFVTHAVSADAVEDFQVDGAEIYFRHLDVRVQLSQADQGKTLLQLAENHGVALESGCRQGMCGTCKLTLKEGQINGHRLGNAVYLCSAYPASQRLVLDA